MTLQWLDAAGVPLLNVNRRDARVAVVLRTEELPELAPAGSAVPVPYSPATVWVGSGEMRAGLYTHTLGVHGKTREDARQAVREITGAAARTKQVWRSGRVLMIANFTKLSRKSSAGSLAFEYVAAWQPALPYWLTRRESLTFAAGTPQTPVVVGDVRASLNIQITAGASAVVNPTVTTNAGVTTWLGTIPAGSTLTIDTTPGLWTVKLGAVDVSPHLRGPQPYLEPRAAVLSVMASGATVFAEWQEGEYE